MTTSIPIPYPTTTSLQFSDIPGSLPSDQISEDIDLSIFPTLAKDKLLHLQQTSLTTDSIWRDFFAITGTLRTFNGSPTILKNWKGGNGFRELKVGDVRVSRMTATSSWIDVEFTFVFEDLEKEKELKRNCFGIVSFISDEGGKEWKIWMLRTMLENFSDHANPDDPSLNLSSPVRENTEFQVIVIGAGQCGLSVAGRLGALGISYLLLEKESHVGNSWTGKYDSVKQHTVREMNNLPFGRTYRVDDPILLPAKRVAEGFRVYSEKYRINCWVNAQTERCLRTTQGWKLDIKVDGSIRTVSAKHLVLTIGGSVSIPLIPDIPQRENFKDDVLNLGNYKNCKPWSGKKGVVVGSGTSGHDVAQDMLNAGFSKITMIQRGKTPVIPVEWVVEGQSMKYNMNIPPVEADRFTSLMPTKIDRELMKLNMEGLMTASSSRYDALEKVGFKVDRDFILTESLLLRGGGYYIDVGTTKHVMNGDIKVKSGIKIKNFTEHGLRFEDGEEISADLVVFATGYQRDLRYQAAQIVGHEIARTLPQHWILNADGEVNNSMKPGSERLWVMKGAVNDARFQSRFIALQIQAELLGRPLPDCRWGGSDAEVSPMTPIQGVWRAWCSFVLRCKKMIL